MGRGIVQGMERGIVQGMAKGIVKGIARGRAEGKAEGEADAQKTIAINMLREGASISFIVKVTGLDIEEIQSLETV